MKYKVTNPISFWKTRDDSIACLISAKPTFDENVDKIIVGAIYNKESKFWKDYQWYKNGKFSNIGDSEIDIIQEIHFDEIEISNQLLIKVGNFYKNRRGNKCRCWWNGLTTDFYYRDMCSFSILEIETKTDYWIDNDNRAHNVGSILFGIEPDRQIYNRKFNEDEIIYYPDFDIIEEWRD